ncbi:hypothetical protein B0T22DRAFT_481079 [Podospora appendiculata]|uniref:Beta/gamma crystallin 'Greek key' domain-containing protein n=1 Tax=Podospora appendiculata TaxID=314037 RepID=A0AAE1CDU6_9PEZI|nr:hypothetical protein B0T22DRAFT_481079 [Podospora appendiculata]
MVSMKALAAVLALNAMTASAAPTAEAVQVADRAIAAQASIYFCEHTRWNGACRNVLVNLDRCTSVPDGWNDRISSIRNDSKSYYKCIWYIDGNCQGKSYDNQEDANLADGNGNFNDAISSYSCRVK